MSDPFREQKIQNWAAEFSDRDVLKPFALPVREYSRELVATFLLAACRKRNAEPAELTEADLKEGLLSGPARMPLPPEAHEKAVEICALFVQDLQQQGRMAAGRTLAPFVRALHSTYKTHSAGNVTAATGVALKGKTFVNPGSKLGLNDPCPCGSGLKYKKCCKRLLG